jgi:hypothetical protein
MKISNVNLSDMVFYTLADEETVDKIRRLDNPIVFLKITGIHNIEFIDDGKLEIIFKSEYDA